MNSRNITTYRDALRPLSELMRPLPPIGPVDLTPRTRRTVSRPSTGEEAARRRQADARVQALAAEHGMLDREDLNRYADAALRAAAGVRDIETMAYGLN